MSTPFRNVLLIPNQFPQGRGPKMQWGQIIAQVTSDAWGASEWGSLLPFVRVIFDLLKLRHPVLMGFIRSVSWSVTDKRLEISVEVFLASNFIGFFFFSTLSLLRIYSGKFKNHGYGSKRFVPPSLCVNIQKWTCTRTQKKFIFTSSDDFIS